MRNKFVMVIVLLAALAGCTRQEKTAAISAAPDFTLKDLAGKAVHLGDLKGKVVLVEFWATWCPPCRESIPGMERLHKAYQGKGLVVLGVSMDTSGLDEIRSFAKEFGISYPVLRGDDEVAAKYMVRAIPMVYIVNKDGMIAKQYLGGAEEGDLEKDIKSLL
ncbi:MAG: TlpA family protein disulfide reductase [Nitrospirota bacterium]|nr:TlpA family protein disulfide reductase [Nitrospirota bacterium]